MKTVYTPKLRFAGGGGGGGIIMQISFIQILAKLCLSKSYVVLELYVI